MQKVISEKTVTIQSQEDIKLSAFLFEKFAQTYGIPTITIDQVRLLLLELLASIHNNQFSQEEEDFVSLTFKLFEQGGLSLKVVNKGQAFNPFEQHIVGKNRFANDFKMDTLGWHLAHKYMDICTYHRAVGYNIIYMKKEQV